MTGTPPHPHQPFISGISVSAIGTTAHQHLIQNRSATVIGVSSRGIFLKLTSDWILFLSSEPHRGPLTLNITGIEAALKTFHKGNQAEFQPKTIYFPDQDLNISISTADLWQALPPDGSALPPAELIRNNQGVESILHTDHLTYLDPLTSAISSLEAALTSKQLESSLDAIQLILGYGPGLTPLGDDILLGLLLALNRWNHLLIPGFNLHILNQEICSSARLKTTTLSANLITCATHGQADERLVSALDGLMTGKTDLQTCAKLLASWGSSSGRAALVGMNLAIKNLVSLTGSTICA